MPRQAAPCIDRWNSRLLMQAIELQPEIADCFGTICANINDGKFGPRAMDIIRLGRLVGIPKEGGGIRTITLSSFLAKLTGALVWDAAKPRCGIRQFAIAKKNGHERIIHKTRAEYETGKAVIRVDVSNAYNTAVRAQITELLKKREMNTVNMAVSRFFDVMYVPISQLAVFKPGGQETEFVQFEEGIRQGDAFSSFFFCLLMDEVMGEISEAYPDARVRGYMDDLTVTCQPDVARQVAHKIVEVLRKWCFKPNPEKSKILCKNANAIGQANGDAGDAAVDETSEMQICDDSQMFIVLGGNVTSSYQEFNEKQLVKHERFFECMRKVPIHSQVAFTIARLCAAPRCKYYASVTPPEHSIDTLTVFQRNLVELVERVLEFKIPEPALHQRFGIGLPDYVSNAEALYKASYDHAILRTELRQVSLVTNLHPDSDDEWTAHLLAQSSAEWMYYVPRGQFNHLTSSEFNIAMAIRCRAISDAQRNRIQHMSCNCGFRCKEPEDVLQHSIECTNNDYTLTHRHSAVKHALARAIRDFGLHVTVEPGFYKYANDLHQRPDVTVHLAMQPLTTDVVICQQEDHVGQHAKEWARRKRRTHDAAVSQYGHRFVPFALETHGHRDSSCYDFIDKIARTLQPYQRWHFKTHVTSPVSTALARARVNAVLSTKQIGLRLLL
jgi:hypothetical protein